MRLFPIPNNPYHARVLPSGQNARLPSARSRGWWLSSPWTPFDMDLFDTGDVRDTPMPATAFIRDAACWQWSRWFAGWAWTSDGTGQEFKAREVW